MSTWLFCVICVVESICCLVVLSTFCLSLLLLFEKLLGELWLLLLLEVGIKAALSVDLTVKSLSYAALVVDGTAVTSLVAVCVVSAGSDSRRTKYFKELEKQLKVSFSLSIVSLYSVEICKTSFSYYTFT